MAWAMCYSIARLIATMPGNSMSNGMVQLVLGGLWNQPALLPELLCILGADGCVVTTTLCVRTELIQRQELSLFSDFLHTSQAKIKK